MIPKRITFRVFSYLLLCFFVTDFTYAVEFKDSVLKMMNIPCIVVSTIDAEEPEEEWIYAPEGYTGKTIDAEYVNGKVTFLLNDSVYYDSGEYLPGASGMRIKVRGNSSALWAKKSFKIKLTKKADLFFRGDSKYKSKEWILLNCPKLDLNTLVGFKVSEILGMEWTPECRFVNLVINDDYRGVYVMTEAVEKDKGRINISDDGFVIEDDAYWWAEELYFKGNMLPDYEGYTFKYPDVEDISDSLLEQIKDYVFAVEDRLLSHEDVGNYLDIESFAKWLLVHDILGTEDGRGSNRYFYKNSLSDGSLLKIGPVWDFDNIFAIKDDWSQQHSGNYRFYYKYLLEYASFNNEFQNQWEQVRYTLYDDVMSFLHNLKAECGEDLDISRYFDSQRWKKSTFESLEEEIDKVDAWMRERIVWIEENIKLPVCVEHVSVDESEQNRGVWLLDGRKLNGKMPIPAGLYIIDGKKLLITGGRF